MEPRTDWIKSQQHSVADPAHLAPFHRLWSDNEEATPRAGGPDKYSENVELSASLYLQMDNNTLIHKGYIGSKAKHKPLVNSTSHSSKLRGKDESHNSLCVMEDADHQEHGEETENGTRQEGLWKGRNGGRAY